MNTPLRIVADENIPLLDELLADKCHITRLSGRNIRQQDLLQADVLLVRSVTQVNAQLLENTPVRFVGTCTIGVDHIDQTYLAQRNIAFSNAPGCNANGVVDYVLAALLALNPALAHWQAKQIGIVGYGEVGSRLYQRLNHVGMSVIAYDPFKTATTASFEQILACDVICLHTPLTRDGDYPTLNLFNAQVLQRLKPNTVLLNAGRGEVVDNQALLALLQAQKLQAVFDVYQDEPQPEPELLDALDIATAHIAGYSLHGKMRGTIQVVEALFACMRWSEKLPDLLQQYTLSLTLNQQDTLAEIVQKVYDIRLDSARFIAHYQQAERHQRQGYFDDYRKHYNNRYEFAFVQLANANPALHQDLLSLGFRVVE